MDDRIKAARSPAGDSYLWFCPSPGCWTTRPWGRGTCRTCAKALDGEPIVGLGPKSIAVIEFKVRASLPKQVKIPVELPCPACPEPAIAVIATSEAYEHQEVRRDKVFFPYALEAHCQCGWQGRTDPHEYLQSVKPKGAPSKRRKPKAH